MTTPLLTTTGGGTTAAPAMPPGPLCPQCHEPTQGFAWVADGTPFGYLCQNPACTWEEMFPPAAPATTPPAPDASARLLADVGPMGPYFHTLHSLLDGAGVVATDEYGLLTLGERLAILCDQYRALKEQEVGQ